MSKFATVVVVVAAALLASCAGIMTIPGKAYALSDGTELAFTIQRSAGTGGMEAMNPKTGERFTGQYTATEIGGGSSIVQLTNWRTGSMTTGRVNTSSDSAIARGILRGDKGTVIDVHLDIEPGLMPRGHGEGVDNKGNRYQFQFG